MSPDLILAGIVVIVIIAIALIAAAALYDSTRKVYYHYTTAEAAAEIIRSNLLIRSDRSRTGDAFYGTGVYLTQLPPSAGKSVIAMNNWDGGRNSIDQILRSGKLPQIMYTQNIVLTVESCLMRARYFILLFVYSRNMIVRISIKCI